MADEKQTSAEKIIATDAAASEKTAPDTQADDEVQRKALLDKHAQLGRELKAANEAKVKAEERSAALEAEREQTRYESMNDEQKADFRRSQAVLAKEAPKTENLKNEKDLLKIIASTDDPKITKALSALYHRSEERNRFPDKETVEAFVEGLTPDEEEPEEPATEKQPVKVTATAGTKQVTVSIDDEVKAAEDSVKKKDGKYTYGELLGLRQQRDRAKAAASKG